MKRLSCLSRELVFSELATDEFDLIVIGGGITGAGIALDAASRGMKTVLIEMQDFAAGTSSRSTKLIHGGLRYLQQLEFKLVATVGKERAIVYENGPHVTTPTWMLLPFHKGSNLGPFTTRFGLTLYDFLAGVKRSEKRSMLTKEETLQKEPLIKEASLIGAGYYVEYKTDDARLTIEVIKKAVDYGATAINYTKATSFHYNGNDKIIGVEATDILTGKSLRIKGKKIINAAGPWVDTLREMDGSKVEKTILLSKGIHLVFDQNIFPLKHAVYFDTPDKRMIFAIPRANKTYVGTTDTHYTGDKLNPRVTKEDRDYLLQAIEYMFPSLQLKPHHVESSWAGLRPLIADASKVHVGEISRKDEILISPSGLISIAGGKLTGYRKMAEDIVNLVARQRKEEEGILFTSSETKQIPISGGDVGGSSGFEAFEKVKLAQAKELGISESDADKLIQRYGSNVDHVYKNFFEHQFEAVYRGIHPALFAELKYTMESEAVVTPSDFYSTNWNVVFEIESVKSVKDAVVDYMEDYFSWTLTQKASYEAELTKQIQAASLFT